MDVESFNDIPYKRCPLQFGNRNVLNKHMRLVHKIEVKSMNTENIVKSKTEFVISERRNHCS